MALPNEGALSSAPVQGSRSASERHGYDDDSAAERAHEQKQTLVVETYNKPKNKGTLLMPPNAASPGQLT